jgi:hypothetical protein
MGDSRPRAGGERNNFVAVRMKAAPPSGNEKASVYEKAFRIPIPASPKATPVVGNTHLRRSKTVLSVSCIVEDFAMASLSKYDENRFRLLLGCHTFLYGISQDANDPSKYYVTYGGVVFDKLPPADRKELGRVMESWLRRNFASRVLMYVEEGRKEEIKGGSCKRSRNGDAASF